MMSILSFSGPRLTTRHLTLAALLVALQIILGKLSVGDPAVLKFSFGFIATALLVTTLDHGLAEWQWSLTI